jgi:glycine/D-amino acid oxidase-like deaminating enzyme
LEHLKLNEEEHLNNLEKLKIITKQPTSVNSGKAGFRAVAKDHMPIVGQINGVFLNTCHGSRASVSAPISAEIIASLIMGTAPPLEERELKALSPLRFN